MDLAADSSLAGKTAAQSWAERALELVDPAHRPSAVRRHRVPAGELPADSPDSPRSRCARSRIAEDLIESEPVSSEKARVAVQHAQILMNCDMLTACRDRALAARDLAAETGDRDVEVQARGIYGLAFCTLGALARGTRRAGGEPGVRRDVCHPDEGGDEARARAALARSFCLYWLGFPDAGSPARRRRAAGGGQAWPVPEPGFGPPIVRVDDGARLPAEIARRHAAPAGHLALAASLGTHGSSPKPGARLALANGHVAEAERALNSVDTQSARADRALSPWSVRGRDGCRPAR